MSNKVYRVGAIGRTGKGNYGHLLEMVWRDIPNTELVAIADADPDGLRAAGERTGATGLYTDYRAMLAHERLDIVSVCPRWADERADMVIACAEAGVKGIFCEKPFAQTLAQADAMMAACHKHDVRVAVAHRRACAHEQLAKQMIADGVIGEVQTLRGHGKADQRAGALDLMILGTHILDSMRFFAGADVAWASGHVTQDGREVTLADVREGDEGIGLLAGNGVAAYYVFQNGVTAHYESIRGSRPGERSHTRYFGLEIYGTKGILSLRNSPIGELYHYPHGLWLPDEADGRWERIVLPAWEQRPDGTERTDQERTHLSNIMIVNELLRAMAEGREVVSVSSGDDARAALEMIMAVHESHRLGCRVAFPMANRENPYRIWQQQAERAQARKENA